MMTSAWFEDVGLTPGEKLRNARVRMALTLRHVHARTVRVATYFDNDEFIISIARLSEIERKGVVPNVYRLSALAIVYDLPLESILKEYGVEVRNNLHHEIFGNEDKALAAHTA
jgi:transcriptional regulator with XRE-family HTH domain